MTALQKRIEAIEKVGAEALADHALQKLIHLQVQKYEKQLAEVRRVQRTTKRIYSIMYSERFENKATVRAGELIKAGAIGKVLQTTGLGPHRLNNVAGGVRPPWFYDRKLFGGIICDIASHQFDQFLFFTGSTQASVVASQVGNVHHPQYPLFEDFGDVMLRGDGGMGYIRVDWFTPDGLSTWGDGRLTIIGTDGFIEISAVCTHPDYRGRGYGAALMRVVGDRIISEGDTPFLHAYADNTGAIALYRKLGFEHRAEVTHAVWSKRHG